MKRASLKQDASSRPTAGEPCTNVSPEGYPCMMAMPARGPHLCRYWANTGRQYAWTESMSESSVMNRSREAFIQSNFEFLSPLYKAMFE